MTWSVEICHIARKVPAPLGFHPFLGPFDLLRDRQLRGSGEVAGAAGTAENAPARAAAPVPVGTGRACGECQTVDLSPEQRLHLLIEAAVISDISHIAYRPGAFRQ